MIRSLIVGLLMVGLLPGLVFCQETESAEADLSDPTAMSRKIEETLSQIRELDQLRVENARLQERVRELETRLDEIAQVDLRGVIAGSDKNSAALLQVGGKVRLVRVGDVFTPPTDNNQSTAQPIVVKEILADAVHLEIGESGQKLIVR